MAHKSNHSRRGFLRQSIFVALTVPFLGLLGKSSLTFAKEKKGGGSNAPLPPGEKAVSESDPVASALGFKHNVKDIDYTKYPQRKKPEAKNQFCKNCALFTKVNDGWGKCQMITSGLVNSDGWCGSWSKKS